MNDRAFFELHGREEFDDMLRGMRCRWPDQLGGMTVVRCVEVTLESNNSHMYGLRGVIRRFIPGEAEVRARFIAEDNVRGLVEVSAIWHESKPDVWMIAAVNRAPDMSPAQARSFAKRFKKRAEQPVDVKAEAPVDVKVEAAVFERAAAELEAE